MYYIIRKQDTGEVLSRKGGYTSDPFYYRTFTQINHARNCLNRKRITTHLEIEEWPKYGHIRTDDDGHNYLVPSEEVEAFDELDRNVDNANWNGQDELFSQLCGEFIEKYDKYRIDGIGNLKVIMD